MGAGDVRQAKDREPMARPKSFDPDDALDEAMRAFWRRGYAATSIHDLTEAMGINKFSLYSTFGDKRAVFLAALDRYTKRVVGTMLADLEAPEAGLAEIRQYFEIIVGGATRSHEVCGCLMTNSGIELAPEDAEIRRKVRKHLRRTTVNRTPMAITVIIRPTRSTSEARISARWKMKTLAVAPAG